MVAATTQVQLLVRTFFGRYGAAEKANEASQRELAKVAAVGFEPTPFRNGALSHRLRPLGQTVLLGLEVTAAREGTSIEARRHEPAAAAALMVERRRNRNEEMAWTEPT